MNKHYIVCIQYFEEEDLISNDVNTPRLYCADSLEQAKRRLAAEFQKTIDYAKEHNIDTSEENEDFSTWMNEDENAYEIQSDCFFFEKGQILEAETA